jgi:hypothetical protein
VDAARRALAHDYARVLKSLARETNVPLDWLLCGDGGAEPVYRKQTRTKGELKVDLAQELANRVAEAARSVAPDLREDMVSVDAERILEATAKRAAEEFVRALERLAAMHYVAGDAEVALWGLANFSQHVEDRAADERERTLYGQYARTIARHSSALPTRASQVRCEATGGLPQGRTPQRDGRVRNGPFTHRPSCNDVGRSQ